MVKVGVTLGLALLFGLGLPALLIQLSTREAFRVPAVSGDLAMLTVLLTASGMYISSLSSSGVRAMVLSLPIGVAVALFVKTVSGALVWVTVRVAGPWMAHIVTGAVGPSSVDPADVALVAARGFSLTLTPLLLWFGFVNHRSSERSRRRVLQQAVSMAALIITAMVLVGGVLAYYEWRSPLPGISVIR